MLEEQGVASKTILIIASDHGETIGEHQFLDHGHNLYQEQVHIPLIVLGVESGKVIDTPVGITDVFPTVLNYIKIPLPQNLQGRDLFSSGSERPVLAEI